jgi:hypothetical protein
MLPMQASINHDGLSSPAFAAALLSFMVRGVGTSNGGHAMAWHTRPCWCQSIVSRSCLPASRLCRPHASQPTLGLLNVTLYSCASPAMTHAHPCTCPVQAHTQQRSAICSPLLVPQAAEQLPGCQRKLPTYAAMHHIPLLLTYHCCCMPPTSHRELEKQVHEDRILTLPPWQVLIRTHQMRPYTNCTQ